MKRAALLLSALMMTTAGFAASPAELLEHGTATARTQAEAAAYDQAAATIEHLRGDIAVTGETGWPDALYALARYQARAGQNDKALTSLEQAVAMGASVRAAEVKANEDLAGLRETPRFQAAVAMLEARAKLWQVDSALATPYKPVLSAEEKAAGVSKIWAETRFNFPFFDRVPDLDWDGAYMAALQEAQEAKTTEDYYRVLMRFTAALKDGHTRLLPPQELMDTFNGVTAVTTRLIQDKIIVTAVSDPALEAKGLRTGAEVIAIDGKPALAYAKTDVEPYVFGYTPQDRAVWQYGLDLLRGPVGTPVQLTLRNGDGKIFAVAVPRFHNEGMFGILPKLDAEAVFKLLPGNIAYLRIDEFANDAGLQMLKENFAAASAADGLVIDLRNNGGGDDDNSHNLVAVLADKPFMGSRWRALDYKPAFRSWQRPIGWYRSGAAPVFQPNKDLHYGKPVVVLIGGRTYSAAEDFLVSYVSSGRGKLVGEASGGSTGNPMLLKLPGGGMAFICTKDDSFYDGRVFEGVGVAPDIEVKPTVADIRAGRDPVLERAVKLLKP